MVSLDGLLQQAGKELLSLEQWQPHPMRTYYTQ